MKFTLTKASDLNYEENIDINNLDDLKELQGKYKLEIYKGLYWNNPKLIIDFNTMEIVIYDFYLE